MKKSKGKFISSIGEFGLIDFIKKNNTKFTKQHNVIVDVGDDCFCFKTNNSKEKFLVTTDILIEDVHFKTCWATPKQIAQKAVEVNVSDVAAMGGAKPLYMFISVGIPQKTTTKFIKELFKNIKLTAEKYSIHIAGGDTVSAEKLTISITIIAKSFGKIITRTTSKTNDIICTTGTFGNSFAGLKILQENKKIYTSSEKFLIKQHLEPKAKLSIANLMAASNVQVTSMTDCSDGLLKSIELLTTDNNKGAIINLEQIPVAKQLTKYINFKKDKIYEYALSGGEEFELVFTIKPSSKIKLKRLIPSVNFIGYVTNSKEVKFFENGKQKQIKINRFKHF